MFFEHTFRFCKKKKHFVFAKVRISFCRDYVKKLILKFA